MTERQEFLANRTGIGGSTAGKILGVSRFGDAGSAYDEIIRTLDGHIFEDEDKPIPPDLERGQVLEPVAVGKYVAVTERMVRKQPQRRHPEHDWMIGNVDRQIIGSPKGPGILEIKCPRYRTFQDVKEHGLQPAYLVQLQHYLSVYGYDWGSFGIFHADSMSLIHFDVERNHEFINDVLIPRLEEFWFKHVMERNRPDPDALPDVDMPRVGGELTIIDSEPAQEAAALYIEAVAKKKEWAKVETKAKRMISELAGGLGGLEIPGLLKGKAIQGRPVWADGAKQHWDAVLNQAGIVEADFKVPGKPYWKLTPVKGSTYEQG
jgi:predicted phage-related endonuclease